MAVNARTMLAVATSLTVLSAGCSNVDEPPPEAALVEPSVAKDADTGLLTVRFQYLPRTSLYAEGARHYLQVKTTDGDLVLRRDEGTDQGPGAGYKDSVRLTPGNYQVQTFQVGCDYTEGPECEETVGRAEDWCRGAVSIEPETKTEVTIKMRLGEGLGEGCNAEVS